MITEIPSFLLVNEAKTPNDAVLIVKNSVVENAYPAFVVNAESARPAAAFNIEADDGYGLTQTADDIYNAGIGTFDYVSYPFCGQGVSCFFAVLGCNMYDGAVLLPLLLCRRPEIENVGLFMHRDDMCYAVSLFKTKDAVAYKNWQCAVRSLCEKLNVMTLDFLEVGYLAYPR